MRKQLTAMLAGALLLPARMQTAEAPAPEELETFVVSGEQPGPGLWKVTRDDHVMWVLASYAPLPKGMTWRSKQIEARIAESQEVLYAPNVMRDDQGRVVLWGWLQEKRTVRVGFGLAARHAHIHT